MADVRLFPTPDGGEIECIAGQLVMDEGLDTAVYLSLFGGNADDSGAQGEDAKTWWGNLSETDATRQFRGETQFLLNTIAATSGNIVRIKDAIENDLAWMTETKLASFVNAVVWIPARNAVEMAITIVIEQKEFVLSLGARWGGTS